MDDLELTGAETGILAIDWQEKLVRAMPPERAERATRNALTLLEMARRLKLPVVATEQYPKGLGPTIAPLSEALRALEPPVVPLSKLEFSAAASEVILDRILSAGRARWVVLGAETHVCVYQTVRDLIRIGRTVHVVADACVSRRDENWARGLALIEQAGAVVTSTEVVLFDLLKRAGTEDFRALSRLIR